MKHKMLKNAMILGFSGVCAKSFDFAFRAFYSRRLGAEGMGLLSLGFGVHGVMLTVATAGLGVAVSKIVSEYLEKGDRGAVLQSMKLAVSAVAALSLFLITLTFLGAEWIAGTVLGDVRVTTGLCCLVPSVLFMGISYCLKGYFYAARKVIIPASSEFLEQAVKFAAITLLLRQMLPKGIAYGCAAVFAGISIGELSSCLYLSLFFLKDAAFLYRPCQSKGILLSIFKVSFPSMLTSLIGAVLRMQEEVWIIAALRRYGASQTEAVGSLGLLYGMVMPMLVFPLTLIGSVTTLLVPEVARADASNHRRLRRITKKIYCFGVCGGVLVMLCFWNFSEQTAQFVYHETKIAPMIKMLSFLCPVMFVDSLSCAMLNGMGNQLSMLCYSVSDSVLRLLGICLLLPHYGMAAMFPIIIGSNLYTCALSSCKVLRRVGIGTRLLSLLPHKTEKRCC